MSADIDTSLNEPGTYVLTLERVRQGYRLNKLSSSLTDPDNRKAFLADEEAYMEKLGLFEAEKELIRRRDWGGMIARGGSIYLILKIAGTLGQTLLGIGAQMRGQTLDEFLASRPPGPTGVANREALS